jgi:hypothetical protein
MVPDDRTVWRLGFPQRCDRPDQLDSVLHPALRLMAKQFLPIGQALDPRYELVAPARLAFVGGLINMGSRLHRRDGR